MKILRARGMVPPGGLVRYRDPDDGWEFAHPYYEITKQAAHAHRVQLGKEIPFDWEDWFDAQVCVATPQACVDVPDKPIEAQVSLGKMAANFTRAMVHWAKAGLPVTPYEEFRKRYVACAGDETHARCPHFSEFSGFGLTRCGKCGCFGVKLRLLTEHCPIGKW